MSPTDLQQFLAILESNGELARISVETDPRLEIAAITDRVCKRPDGGQALLFERPASSRFPVATNLFGSPRRNALALGIDSLGELTDRMTALLDRIPVLEPARIDRQITALPGFAGCAPRTIDSPAWNVPMVPPDLSQLPLLQSWPGDGAAEGHPRYITLPQVFTSLPDGSAPNCGLYRAQLRGPRELAVRWKAGSGAARHLEAFHRLGKPMPVAIALGGPPAALLSAMLPLPGDLDEMTFAGFLCGTAVDLAPCRTVPLRVPASSEVVIEGYVDSSETVVEGPFGNHTGFYSPAGPAALMRVTAISQRAGAIIPATVVGPPPMEDCWMAQVWERLLLAILKKLIPAIVELHFPLEWVFHQSAIISLENPNPDMVRDVAAALWGTPWFKDARLIMFINADTDPADHGRVAWRGINLADCASDLFHDDTRQRTALDATGSGLGRPGLEADPATVSNVIRRWHEYGI